MQRTIFGTCEATCSIIMMTTRLRRFVTRLATGENKMEIYAFTWSVMHAGEAILLHYESMAIR